MKHEYAICLMALAITPPLCQAQSNQEEKALGSFKSLMQRHVNSYKMGGRVHVSELGGGWAKEVFTIDPASVKFDVGKTSSLVSPFVGTLTFTLNRSFTAFHQTEVEAAADDVFVKGDSTIHKHVFAYQDRQWKPTVRKYSDPRYGDSFDCDELLLKKTKPSERDIHGCLEEFDDGK